MTQPTLGQMIHKAAENIALVGVPGGTPERPDYCVHFTSAGHPPTDVQAIENALLSGNVWLSWISTAGVVAAMTLLHGEPAADSR